MTRSISNLFREAIQQRETDEVVIVMLVIEHDALPVPIRVCLNPGGVVSRGNEYLFYPFRLALPEERENQAPQSKLVIDNVDLGLMATLRSIATAPSVTIEMVIASTPDTLEYQSAPLTWKQINYDVTTIEGVLEGPRIFFSRYPADVNSPATVPGIFFGGPNL